MILAHDKLREFAAQRSLSINGLAKYIGCSQAYLYNLLEKRKDNPSKAFLKLVEERTEIKMADWFRGA